MTEECYKDRNLLAKTLLKQLYETGFEVGWYEEDSTEDDWVVIYAELPTGQISYHIPREDLDDWIPEKENCYDGHSNEEKRERLEQFYERIL